MDPITGDDETAETRPARITSSARCPVVLDLPQNSW